MPIKTLETFQDRAIESAVAVFGRARTVLDAAGDDEQGRATAIHDNGYLLIEAPTAAGKTLVAGNIVERMSARDRVVWFWFAPFKGVVDQSAAFLRETVPPSIYTGALRGLAKSAQRGAARGAGLWGKWDLGAGTLVHLRSAATGEPGATEYGFGR